LWWRGASWTCRSATPCRWIPRSEKSLMARENKGHRDRKNAGVKSRRITPRALSISTSLIHPTSTVPDRDGRGSGPSQDVSNIIAAYRNFPTSSQRALHDAIAPPRLKSSTIRLTPAHRVGEKQSPRGDVRRRASARLLDDSTDVVSSRARSQRTRRALARTK